MVSIGLGHTNSNKKTREMRRHKKYYVEPLKKFPVYKGDRVRTDSSLLQNKVRMEKHLLHDCYLLKTSTYY